MSGSNGHADALKAALDSMPATMAALMREYIDNKDVTSRIQTRLRMKALLDFAGIDTEWPPNPLIEKKMERGPEPAREAAIRDAQALGLVGGAASVGIPAEETRTPPRVGIDNSNIVG